MREDGAMGPAEPNIMLWEGHVGVGGTGVKAHYEYDANMKQKYRMHPRREAKEGRRE